MKECAADLAARDKRIHKMVHGSEIVRRGGPLWLTLRGLLRDAQSSTAIADGEVYLNTAADVAAEKACKIVIIETIKHPASSDPQLSAELLNSWQRNLANAVAARDAGLANNAMAAIRSWEAENAWPQVVGETASRRPWYARAWRWMREAVRP